MVWGRTAALVKGFSYFPLKVQGFFQIAVPHCDSRGRSGSRPYFGINPRSGESLLLILRRPNPVACFGVRHLASNRIENDFMKRLSLKAKKKKNRKSKSKNGRSKQGCLP